MAIMLTLDEALSPSEMGCAVCGGRMKVYPCPLPKGTGVCPTCSPAWLESFATYQMNEERVRRGLARL